MGCGSIGGSAPIIPGSMASTSTLRVFNTLGRSLEDFVPRDAGRVGMYVCGPTVQSEPHLGHGRFAVVFDVIARYLRWRGLDVTYVRNVTDVEDKIIAAANEAGESMAERAERMTAAFHRVFEDLRVLPPDIEPKATEHIDEIVRLIAALIDRGLAYRAENDDVYFSVKTLEGYGRLSGRNPDDMRAGARIEVNEAKHDPLDFALWKAAKPGEPYWDSPWSAGRPGWHIECSAMAARYLGEGFDIHGGGSDLIFPHHENEIAQSEGATGEPFARYWLHNGMVNLGGEKMSKSTGLVIDLSAAIERFGGRTVRMLYLRAHYRSPLEFSEALMEEAAASLERIDRAVDRAGGGGGAEADAQVLAAFQAAMDDDFATPQAIGVIFDAAREINRVLDEGGDAGPVAAAVVELLDVLGLCPDVDSSGAQIGDLAEDLARIGAGFGVDPSLDPATVLDRLLEVRSQARKAKDFATSDGIRDGLAAIGVGIEDSADGSRWLRR